MTILLLDRTDSDGFSRFERSLVLTNAKIVTSNGVVDGTVHCTDGNIAQVSSDPVDTTEAIDCGGDFLLPGLIDVHTDHLEKHAMPRAGIYWDPLTAALSHDAAMVSAGTTTVFDSLCVGAVGVPARRDLLHHMISGIDTARRHGLFAADHYLHLRADIVEPDLSELISRYLDHTQLRFLTVMDDSIARNPDQFRRVMRRRGKPEVDINKIIDQGMPGPDPAPKNRKWLIEEAARRDLLIANHDDTLPRHSTEAAANGMALTEFPLSLEAARVASDCGMKIIAGAPNLVLGKSHVGNVAVIDLIRAGYVDILCSDYVPASLLQAIFALANKHNTHSLPQAVRLATLEPAHVFGLEDRGELAAGKKADILRVGMVGDTPILRGVWINAKRVK